MKVNYLGFNHLFSYMFRQYVESHHKKKIRKKIPDDNFQRIVETFSLINDKKPNN